MGTLETQFAGIFFFFISSLLILLYTTCRNIHIVVQSFSLFSFFKKVVCLICSFCFFVEINKQNKKLIMAYGKNSWSNAGKSLNQTGSLVQIDINQSKSSSAEKLRLWSSDRDNQVQKMSNDSAVAKQKGLYQEPTQGVVHYHLMNCGDGSMMNNHHDDGMRELVGLLSNLNPMAQEFEPPIVDGDVKPVLQNSAPHFAYVADGNALVPTNSPFTAGGNSATQVCVYVYNGYDSNETIIAIFQHFL